jgi:hypothetical protein
MECIYVFKNSSPHTQWCKIIASNTTDVDLEEERLLIEFNTYSCTEVNMWKRYYYRNSGKVVRELYLLLSQEWRDSQGEVHSPLYIRRGWILKLTAPVLKLALEKLDVK